MKGPAGNLAAALAARGPEAARLVERAMLVASRAHLGQFRRSGDPYVTHPIAVADIVAGTGADTSSIVAALLHDLPDDTPFSVADIRASFGDDVADLVSGLVELDRSYSAEEIAAADPRVVVLKIADRLHNMQTIEHLGSAKQFLKAGQTLALVAPLARANGLVDIADELDALATATIRRTRARVCQVGSRSTAGLRTSSRVVRGASLLLPARCRHRYQTEWEAELHVLATRRERLAFAFRLLRGLPSMAVITRGTGDRP